MFDTYQVTLGSTSRLPLDYESGHAIGRSYELSTLPSEETLRADLQNLARAYLALTFRGGLEPSPEVTTVEEEVQPGASSTVFLIEVRRYRLHRRIERNSKASEEAKRVHGLHCQACSFDFQARYGELGRGYIEAHHLKPLSQCSKRVCLLPSTRGRISQFCAPTATE